MSLQQAYRGGYGARSGWWLHFAYDPDLIERIKKIPAVDRQWDEDKKRWWVSEEHAEGVATWLHGFEAVLRQKALL